MKVCNIAVIMTVHNRKIKTIECLNYLYKNNLYNIQLNCFITDDGSTDGTYEAIRSNFPKTIVIKGDGNLFWNRGMLTSWIEAAKLDFDYYLWLNDDTVLFNDSLQKLINASKSYNDNSIIVGSTCDNEGSKNTTYGGRKFGRSYKLIIPDDEKCIPCDTFNGNIVLIPQKVFKSVGVNDSYFHHSFGDIDYGLSASKKGFINYIAPGYYGICKRNNPIPVFRRKCYSLIKRYKLLYSPLGFNPKEDFHLNQKYYPLYKCIWWFIKLHINVLFTVDHTKVNNHEL